MTQDLLELFIKYNIPSDLLSYKDMDNRGGTTHSMLSSFPIRCRYWRRKSQTSRRASSRYQNYGSRREGRLILAQKLTFVQDKELSLAQQLQQFATPDLLCLSRSYEPEVECCVEDDGEWSYDEECEEDECDGDEGGGDILPMPPVLRAPIKPAAPPAAPKAISTSTPTQPIGSQAPKSTSATEVVPMEVEEEVEAIDYTQIPKQLDKKYKQLDTDAALRPTIINVGEVWSRKVQKGLLGIEFLQFFLTL